MPPRWRLLHEPTAVQLNPAHVLVTPSRRERAQPPSPSPVSRRPELPFGGDSRHPILQIINYLRLFPCLALLYHKRYIVNRDPPAPIPGMQPPTDSETSGGPIRQPRLKAAAGWLPSASLNRASWKYKIYGEQD